MRLKTPAALKTLMYLSLNETVYGSWEASSNLNLNPAKPTFKGTHGITKQVELNYGSTNLPQTESTQIMGSGFA